MEYVLTLVFGLISTALGFMLKSKMKEVRDLRHEKEANIAKRDAALENAVVCILRKYLMEEHAIWMERGYITSKALESGILMYKAYKDLGGNGMIDHMEEEIRGLPIRD